MGLHPMSFDVFVVLRNHSFEYDAIPIVYLSNYLMTFCFKQIRRNRRMNSHLLLCHVEDLRLFNTYFVTQHRLTKFDMNIPKVKDDETC